MKETTFTNVRIFQGERGFVKGSLTIAGERIREIALSPETGEEEPSCPENASFPGKNGCGETAPTGKNGCGELYILPGLVDIHTHGNSGSDFSDGSDEGLRAMGKYLACHGITSFAPASMTLPYEKLEKAFRTAADYRKNRPADGAKIAGIRMEGPYLSEKKKGAQNGAFLRLPDADEFLKLQESCGHLIRIVDIAPELEGAEEFIRRVSADCRVSLGHTCASFEETLRAFQAGASHITHLFNAMPPLHHREPGVIGAAIESEDVTAELICDGYHIHPAMIRMAFRLFPGRICLISDAARCCGMPDGEYELGGQKITLKNGQARLAEGNLAGAASNLFEDMVNAIRFGIREEEAILSATLNPAKAVGADEETGSLEPGKKADLIVCDREWNLLQVYINGLRIR